MDGTFSENKRCEVNTVSMTAKKNKLFVCLSWSEIQRPSFSDTSWEDTTRLV